MSEPRSYFVYALKDGRTSPAMPFYVGKGSGPRDLAHGLRLDASAKSRRIEEIRNAGLEPLTVTLVSDLTELDALRIEAELISAFGTRVNGGILLNNVIPSLAPNKRKLRGLTLPSGVLEKAQRGLQLLKDALLEFANANPEGVTNSDVSHALGLQSNYRGGSKNYLSYSVLGLLMRDSRLVRDMKKRHKTPLGDSSKPKI
jgi:hypothetical protein